MTSRAEANSGTLARSVGWLALGLGIAQLIAPRRVSRLVGIRPSGLGCWAVRMLGAKEVACGLGILRRENPKQWLRARAISRALDVALLMRARAARKRWFHGGSDAWRLGTGLVGVAGVAALDLLALRNSASSGSGWRT